MKLRFLFVAPILALLLPRTAPAASDSQKNAMPQVPAGWEVVRVAGAPLVQYPMLACFDDRGRLFIAENAGVNLDEKALAEQLPSRITVLEDTDGDGVFDRSSVFADKLAFPEGVQWHDGALYVASAPSIWRLEDKDGDGRADTRTEIATGFKSTGNAADVHGPFLHPNGRLYWCHGRKGHEVYQNNGGALVSKALGARIWSCRPDGSDIQVHAGGGMDNPAEVSFNQEGEIVGTVNIFQSGPRVDALVHWIHGGVFPRNDQEPVLAEFKRTGDLLPPLATLGHVAPSGVMWRRMGEFAGSVFYAEFNNHRIMRVPVAPVGASFRGSPQVFAATDDANVHFTDVLEDLADGSILVIDTGAWFRRGCPTSVVARADVTGAIYRIRKTGTRAPADPRGLAMAWPRASAGQLIALLGDPRPAVRDRALTEIAKRGADTLASLEHARTSGDYLTRSNAVWALTRIATAEAQAIARQFARDHDPRIRQTAAQSAFITSDRGAAEVMLSLLRDESPAVCREAARALGRIGGRAAVAPLARAAALTTDDFLSHALIYALIEIGDAVETQKFLAATEPRTQRAALIALDQMPGGGLAAEPVLRALESNDTTLRAAALDIAARHPDWGAAAAGFLARTAHASPAIVARLLEVFLPTREVREWARANVGARLDPQLVLAALAASPKTWDESWRDFLTSSLASADAARAQAALRAIGTHRTHDFSAALRALAHDAQRPMSLRLAALQTAAGNDTPADAESFRMLTEPLRAGGSAEARLQAATALGSMKLTKDQLAQLVEILPTTGPVELQQLLGAFQRGPADAALGEKLLAALQRSPGRWGVQVTTLQTIFQRFPGAAYENAAPLIAEIRNQNLAQVDRVNQLEGLAAHGDVARGRAAFIAGAGACVSCHRVGETGGKVGPDLSHIGHVRGVRDLVESICFPSATIARGYEAFEVKTNDNRTLVGTLPRETSDTIVVAAADGTETPVPRTAIAKIEPLTTSLMPPGLDRVIDEKTFGDLLSFLKSLQ